MKPESTPARLLAAIGRALTIAVLVAAALAAPRTAAAQTPTPEGTVITNQATATWTDANNNVYTAVNASVSVTVGFSAGVDVQSPVSVSPSSPSTSNQISFTLVNAGNGKDTIGTVSPSAATGVTITGYKIGATSYANLAALTAALNSTEILAGNSVVVTVVYDVASGQGGATLGVTLTATSKRTPSTSDASSTNVTPATNRGVAVTPDGANVDRLPSNGNTYTQVFPVQNSGNASDVFDLSAATSTGAAVTIVSVNGSAGTTSTVTIAAGATANVTVVYSVAGVAAGTTDKLTLTATSQNSGTTSDAGDVTVKVVRAALSIAKVAYRDNQSSLINNTTDRVLPGEYIQYKITVTNTGGASATGVQIGDNLPVTYVTYDSATGDVASDWTISQLNGTVTATLSNPLPANQSKYIWIRVRVK